MSSMTNWHETTNVCPPAIHAGFKQGPDVASESMTAARRSVEVLQERSYIYQAALLNDCLKVWTFSYISTKVASRTVLHKELHDAAWGFLLPGTAETNQTQS